MEYLRHTLKRIALNHGAQALGSDDGPIVRRSRSNLSLGVTTSKEELQLFLWDSDNLILNLQLLSIKICG